MKTGGRKKGTPNKRTQIVIDRLDELECDPLEGLVRIAQEAEQAGDYSLAGRMYSELAQYCYPKRKAVDASISTSDFGLMDISIVGV